MLLHDALSLLGLSDVPRSIDEVQSAFRRTLLRNHPDKCSQDSSLDADRVARARDFLIHRVQSRDACRRHSGRVHNPLLNVMMAMAREMASFAGVPDVEIKLDVPLPDLYSGGTKVVDVPVTRVGQDLQTERHVVRAKVPVVPAAGDMSSWDFPRRIVLSGEGDDPPAAFFAMYKDVAFRLRGDIVITVAYETSYSPAREFSDSEDPSETDDSYGCVSSLGAAGRVSYHLSPGGGSDLNANVPITLKEYYTGLAADIHLPDGSQVALQACPAASAPARGSSDIQRSAVVMSGLGLPREKNDSEEGDKEKPRGDLYVFLDLVLPPSLDLGDPAVSAALDVLSRGCHAI